MVEKYENDSFGLNIRWNLNILREDVEGEIILSNPVFPAICIFYPVCFRQTRYEQINEGVLSGQDISVLFETVQFHFRGEGTCLRNRSAKSSGITGLLK